MQALETYRIYNSYGGIAEAALEWEGLTAKEQPPSNPLRVFRKPAPRLESSRCLGKNRDRKVGDMACRSGTATI